MKAEGKGGARYRMKAKEEHDTAFEGKGGARYRLPIKHTLMCTSSLSGTPNSLAIAE
jgi:hypothetical protein